MLELIKAQIIRKLQNKAFRNMVLKSKVIAHGENFIKKNIGKNALDKIFISFDLRTKALIIYVSSQKIFSNLELLKSEIQKYLNKKFKNNVVKRVSVLKDMRKK